MSAQNWRPTYLLIVKVTLVSWVFVTFMVLRQNHYNTIQYHDTLRWPLYELSIYAFIFKKSKPANGFICSECPYSHDVVPKFIFYKN